MKTINKYLAQAMDCYPYNLEDAIEALDYALSYDENCTMALCLYGRLMGEQLLRFEQAKAYFERALAADINAVEVYPHFLWALIRNEDFEQARKLCDFASTVKGINKFALAMAKIDLCEKMQTFGQAEKAIRQAKLIHSFPWQMDWLETAEKRIKLKRGLAKSKSKSKKDKKKAAS